MRLIVPIAILLFLGCESPDESTPRPSPKNKYASQTSADSASNDMIPMQSTPMPVQPAPQPNPEIPNEDDKDESEGVAPPGNISGAFLVCSVIGVASDASPTTDVGCRFIDSEGERAQMTTIAEKGVFDVLPPPGLQVKIVPAPNGDWEALYQFKGSNAETSKAGALESFIIVNFENLASGDATATVKEELRDVELPLYEWVPVCRNNNCAYKEINRNLFWARGDGQTHDLQGAAASCENLVFAGFSDWRLPVVDEMVKAREEKIESLFYPEKLDLVAGARYWSGTQDTPGSSLSIDWFAAVDGMFQPIPNITAAARAVCVR